MTNRAEKQLTLRIEDKMLSIDKVLEAQRHFVSILHEIDKSKLEQESASIDWIVTSAKGGSYSVTVEGLPKTSEIGDEEVTETIKVLKSGLSSLRKNAERPPFFTDRLLKSAKALAKISSPGLPIHIFHETLGEVSIPKETEVNVDRIIGARYTSYGSVEGKLTVIDIRSKNIFKVTDPITHENIECVFSLDDLHVAKDALGRRVYVYGLVSSREDGTRVRIEVDEVEILPDSKDLPSVDDIVGIWAEEENA